MRRPPAARLRFASWNVRHFLGMDRRIMPGRIVAMLGSLDADVIAVQELDVGQPRSGRIDQPTFIAEALGMQLVFCKTVDYRGGEYGHALFTRLTTRETTIVPLPRLGASEPRAMIEVMLSVGSSPLRVFSTHLSLSAPERAAQARTIATRLAGWRGATAFLGDLNAGPGQIGYQELADGVLRDPMRRLELRRRCTWPAPWPFRALDHVLLSPALHTRDVHVVDRGVARFASDHCPVVADVQLTVDAGTTIAAIRGEER